VLILLLLFFLLFIGMPVGFALGLAGVVGLYLTDGWTAVGGILNTAPYNTIASQTLTAIPMFVLMAEFISKSNIVAVVFNAAHKWFERLPGGLAVSTILASAGLGAMSGSSAASGATMAKIAVPELKKYGYGDTIASGVVAVGGTLAVMIPPSLAFILYGVITETSIGKLFMAGILPGILTTIMYVIGILLMSKSPKIKIPPSTNNFTWRERFNSLRSLWSFVILIIAVLGAIYSGIATVTEAAALGALVALIIVLLMRKISFKDIKNSALSTVKTTSMILIIVMGAMIFGYFLTLNQTAQRIIEYIGTLNIPAWTIMALIVVLYLILGCILDTVAILYITLPLIFPIVIGLGYDPIWFGVILVKVIEIGLVTPPVGMNAFIVSSTGKIPLGKVFKGSALMLACDVVTLALLLSIPALSTWLPSLLR
jgi:C4-dicarboxylate transporter, DctM subunit